MLANRMSIQVLQCGFLWIAALWGPSTFADQAGGNAGVTVDVMKTGKMQVPAEFHPVPPKSRIVQHEFQASAGEGDQAQTARVTMMVSGGGIKANIRRWKGQFAGGDKKLNKTEQLEVGNWTVHLVELNGSFGERMGGGPFAGGKVVQRQNYAMIGAIIMPSESDSEAAGYFVKMIGPAEVIKANRDRLIAMIKTLDK